MRATRRATAITVAVLLGLLLVTVASADHQWGRYKWKSASPVELTIGDNVTAEWDAHLGVAIADWDASDVLTLSEVPGGVGADVENCTPATGKIEVCNYDYGDNGWLGIASIWIAKGKDIVKANARMNDHYFVNDGNYSVDADNWRQLVMCQEIGHDFGLGHQDEDFDNAPLGTCMDYTVNPLTDADIHPNAHDYEQLTAMYGGGDGGGNGGGNGRGGGKPSFAPNPDAGEFGRAVGYDASGRANVFEQDLGNGQKVLTHVFWTY